MNRPANARYKIAGDLTCLVALCLPVVSLANDPDPAECRNIEDDAARLACYDGIDKPQEAEPTPVDSAPVARDAGGEVQTEPDAAEPRQDPAGQLSDVSGTPQPLNEDIGRESLSADKRNDTELNVVGHVVGCKENSTGTHFFFFDNGQVWRQSDDDRIRWRDCDFYATISKDFFGYTMQRDGDKRTVRVKRVE